jgi:hypothetical protein
MYSIVAYAIGLYSIPYFGSLMQPVKAQRWRFLEDLSFEGKPSMSGIKHACNGTSCAMIQTRTADAVI